MLFSSLQWRRSILNWEEKNEARQWAISSRIGDAKLCFGGQKSDRDGVGCLINTETHEWRCCLAMSGKKCENWKTWQDGTRMKMSCSVFRPSCSQVQKCAAQLGRTCPLFMRQNEMIGGHFYQVTTLTPEKDYSKLRFFLVASKYS